MSTLQNESIPWLFIEGEGDEWSKVFGNRAGLETLKAAVDAALTNLGGCGSLNKSKNIPFDEVILKQGSLEDFLGSRSQHSLPRKILNNLQALFILIVFPLMWAVGLAVTFKAAYNFFLGGL